MRIDEQVKALRSNRASQRRIQDAVEAAARDWRGSEPVVPVLEDLERYADGAALGHCRALERLTRSHDHARVFLDDWSRRFSAVLSREPLTQVPFQHNYSRGFATIQLARCGGVSLSLLLYEHRADLETPSSASFADRELTELVIDGGASGMVHRLVKDDGAHRIDTCRESWAPGARIVTFGPDHSRQIVAVERTAAILQLSRTPERPGPTREIALANGELLHQACGDKCASQTEMALAVLGAMGRKDALPAVEAITATGPSHLRWEAVRHALALEPMRGVALLSGIAANAQDELKQPAHALHQKLTALHPQLNGLENERCPA